MKTGTLVLIIIAGVLLVFGGCACSKYNGLVSSDENVKNAWNNVQSDYQRRADLIPNLVNTVKGEANFEKSTLESVMQARASATQIKVDPSNLTPEKIKEFQSAQGEISQALGRLIAVSENYPTLRANDGFRKLQDELAGTENRIKITRNDFNKAVQQYNTQVRTFPNNIFGGMFGFHVKEGFTADAGSDKAPNVQF